MRKLFTLLLCLVSLYLVAQTIDSKKEGEYYFNVSPNGRYYVGTIDASYAHFYDAVEKVSVDAEPDLAGYKINAVNNQGQVAGSNERQGGIWNQGGDWLYLPLPEDATEEEKMWYEATGISDGGKYVVGYLAEWCTRMVVWTLQEEGIYTVDVLPIPEKDPIYKSKPQLVQPRNISDDGTRILARCVNDFGHVHFPLIYERQEDGSWTYKFIYPELVVKAGAEMPEYREDMTEEEITEYISAMNAAESGYYPHCDGALMSSNGKYIAAKVGYQPEGTDYGSYFGIVFDIEKDTAIVFSELKDASCFSVDNYGNVSLGTPSTELFRWSHISNIATPNKIQTLTDWTKERTGGVIDLAQYMMYATSEKGDKVLAEGTTYLASEGTAYFTYQENLIETGMNETFFVYLGEPTDVENVEFTNLLVYPNPTNGLLNISDNISDVVVYDIAGRKVYSQNVVDSTIDLSHLDSGNYLVVVKKDGNLIKSKIIKL